MILFVCALNGEAKPVIEYLDLKQQWQISNQSYYSGNRFGLVVTGIGKIASATGLTRALTINPEFKMIVNLGLCGAKDHQIPFGSLFAVRTIRDHSSGKLYLPDIINKHELHEADLETWDHPVTGEYRDKIKGDLVDMEASGFYQAASMMMESHRIHCLKIVSDHLDPKPPNKSFATGLILQNIDHVLTYLNDAGKADEEQSQALDDQDNTELADLFERWKCTTTQQRLLRLSLSYARLSKNMRLSDTTVFNQPSSSPKQRDQLVDELRKELTKR